MSSLNLPPRKIALAAVLGVLTSGICILLMPSERWLEGVALSSSLSWAAVVDLDRQILPDVLTLGLVAIGLLFATMPYAPPLLDRAGGAFFGFAALALVRSLYARVRKRQGLGLGDAKLFAAGGAWLGWLSLANTMLIASLTALAAVLVRLVLARSVRSDERIAFGPFLAFAIWLIWLFQMLSPISLDLSAGPPD